MLKVKIIVIKKCPNFTLPENKFRIGHSVWKSSHADSDSLQNTITGKLVQNKSRLNHTSLDITGKLVQNKSRFNHSGLYDFLELEQGREDLESNHV